MGGGTAYSGLYGEVPLSGFRYLKGRLIEMFEQLHLAAASGNT